MRPPTTSRARTPRAARGELRERLAQCLEPFGFVPDEAGSANVNYRGLRASRETRIRATVRVLREGRRVGRYAGIYLDIGVPTSLRTRLVSLRARGPLLWISERLMRWRRMSKVERAPSNERVTFWAAEPGWSSDYLTDPAVEEALSTTVLLGDHPVKGTVRHSLQLVPERLSIAARLGLEDIDCEDLVSWMDTAVRLTILAEARPPPPPVALTWFEKQHKKSPKRAVLMTALFLLLGIPLLLLGGTGLVLGAIYLLGGSNALGIFLVGFAAVFMPIAMAIALFRKLASMRKAP